MQDDLIERCGEQHGMCLVGDDCGNLHTMWEAETALIELRARIAALEAKLAEKDALLREARAENARLREALGLIIENESADTGYGNSSAKIARAALGDWKPEAGDLGGDHVR